MACRLGEKYEEFSVALAEIIGKVEDIRERMKYVNGANEVDDEELPWYKLEPAITALGSALAATVVYMNDYKEEAKGEQGNEKA